MRILITPMAAAVETAGSTTRTRAIAQAALARGHEVAFCAGSDINYRPIDGVKTYDTPVPMPFGLPGWAGKRLFPMANRLGIQSRITIRDFEQVLMMIGALDARQFAADVASVRAAISDFRPDVLLSEHRIAPLAAAQLEGLPSAAIYSTPIAQSRHIVRDGSRSGGVRAALARLGLPPVSSALDLYDWASLKIIPSSPELEPLDDASACYVGALVEGAALQPHDPGPNIVAYMGNGTISGRRLIRTLTRAFLGTPYQVYIATKEVQSPHNQQNIHIAPHFAFDDLLDSATMFISHGGQNSMVQGLMHGVPMLACPGHVFERRYNARSVERLGAGRMVEPDQLTPDVIRHACAEFARDLGYRQRATAAAAQLCALGGAVAAVAALEQLPRAAAI